MSRWLFGALIGLQLCVSNKAAEFPDGDHVLPNAVLPFVSGGTIAGVGDGQYIKPGRPLRGEMTVLIPRDPGRPLFTLTGTFWKLRDFTMYGGEQPATLGLLITYPQDKKGIGSGKHNLDRLTMQNFATGIQFGDTLATRNSDSVDGEDLWFVGCPTCINVKNVMGMTSTWENVNANNCGDVFRFEAGGKWRIEDIFCGDSQLEGSIIHLVGTQRKNNRGRMVEKGIGSNNNQYFVTNVNIDTSDGGNKRLLTIDRHLRHTPSIRISDGHIACDDYRKNKKHLIVVRNTCNIVIEGVSGLQAGTFWIEFDPTLPVARIKVVDCELRSGWKGAGDPFGNGDVNGDGQFDGLDLIDPNSPGAKHVRLKAVDCYLQNGAAIPDAYQAGTVE
jgi:hypothetical protein